MRLWYFHFIVIIVLLSSCVTHKHLLNLQGKADTITHFDKIYLIQPGDLLSIKVSSIDPQSVAIFNKEIGTGSSSQVNPGSLYLYGYSVNDSGIVNLPLLGDFCAKNLTVVQVRDSIVEKMKPYYKFVSVDVKLMSFRITVLGEVNSQGVYYMYNDNSNILQGIGMAGGITDYGNRRNIKLVRKNEKTSEVAILDLSKTDIINSPYYYLKPNDVIYVEPLKAKPIRINSPAVQIILSALAFVIVVANFIKRQ